MSNVKCLPAQAGQTSNVQRGLIRHHFFKELKKRNEFVKSGAGFTIIELVVVFSVIAALSTVGIASFVSYSRSQTLQAATYELSTTLSLARSRAYSQVKPSECTDQTSLDGYRVSISISGGSYRMEALCSGASYVRLQKTLPGGIAFSSQTTSTSFFFPVIKGGVIGAGNVVLSGYGLTRTITVNPTGDIR